MWTPKRCSISLRFSLRPPASVRAPSLSSSSSRADGSAIHPREGRNRPRTTDLIKRGQQYKPLLRLPVVVRFPIWVAKVALADHLTVHKRPQRHGIFAVLGLVQFEGVLQPHQL